MTTYLEIVTECKLGYTVRASWRPVLGRESPPPPPPKKKYIWLLPPKSITQQSSTFYADKDLQKFPPPPKKTRKPPGSPDGIFVKDDINTFLSLRSSFVSTRVGGGVSFGSCNEISMEKCHKSKMYRILEHEVTK